ncbi:LOW QUALITY PROTEIN: hypothetical protein V1478_018546 [Vespula squamosa]|uniref:Uncharacterized protein n=1 Tax=Vespula squamosa TaxID=30214 RepID=A0ABD1ZT31_VESSQ
MPFRFGSFRLLSPLEKRFRKSFKVCSNSLGNTCYPKYFRPRSHREEVAAFGDPRANGDSTLNPACLSASGASGFSAHWRWYAAIRPEILASHKNFIYSKYFRPRSHREEVAAFGDPRANGDSTLQFAFRDAFPLRELQASQPTGEENEKKKLKKQEKS